MNITTLDLGQLLGVFVPFFLGVLATVAVPMFTTWWQDKIERRNTSAMKFEEMVTSVYELDNWTDRYRNFKLFNGVEPGPSPLMRIIALSGTYFPDLETPVMKLEGATAAYCLAFLTARTEQQAGRPYLGEAIRQDEDKFLDAKRELVGAMRQYAKRRFQT